MLFRKKKKDEPHKEDVFLAKGIYLIQPVMDNGHIILNCFLRCLIVFLLVFGTIGGFLSAFDISYNYLLVIFFYLILSMYFSFLYASSKLLYRDLGYIAFFAVFIGAIFLLRNYANSGFYEIVNMVLKRAQMFFDLSGVREYETIVNNAYLTVAIVAIFIGMVLIIILNIWLYSTMSLFWTGILTFPFLLAPLYMKLMPDSIYMISLIIGYLAVLVFKANGHYITFAWDTPFRLKGLKKNKMSYTQDSGVFRQLLLTISIFIFCFVMLAQTFYPAKFFDSRFKNDRLREKTSDAIANFVLLGFEGMYNHYGTAGGMSGGKLGGVSNIRPDYRPDLIVSFTPYSNEPIYLKAYTGGLYGDNQWESLYGELGPEGTDVEIFEEESLRKEAILQYDAATLGERYSARARMDVKNVGAEESYQYYPYYTLYDDYSFYRNHHLMMGSHGIRVDESKQYTYYPQIVWSDGLGDITPDSIHKGNVNAVFLDVPEKNREVIEKTCQEIGLNANMTENEIVEAVKTYFEDNIPYTLKPGATPKNKDFINFFLEKNRKGYCAHFASTATLIFRQMGIPARYVEGYAFSLETALASDINEEKKYEEYYHGYSALGKSAVIDVEVTDAMAHAWVEVYVDGFGWKPVEVTPGSNEIAEEDDFWTAFGNFMGGTDFGIGGNGNGLGNLSLSRFSWIGNVVLLLMAAFFLITIIKMFLRKWMRFRKCHQKDAREAAICCYSDICDRLRLCHSDFDLCRSHSEQLDFIARKYKISFDKEEVCQKLEKISFSALSVENEELTIIFTFVTEVRKRIWKQADFKKKFALCKR